MKIDPEIKHRHLHHAAVEQVCRNLEREGFAIEQVGSGALDVIARRGSDIVAAEVKVIGAKLGSSSLSSAVADARRLGASFRLFVIKPEHDTVVEIDRLAENLLAAARREGPEPLGFPAGWTIEKIDHIITDRILIRSDQIEIAGQAYAFLRANAEEEGTPISFKLLVDGDHQLLAGSEIEPLDD